MRVSYVFRLFSDEALRGLFLYKDEIERQCGNSTATVAFVNGIRAPIVAMTSKCSSNALRPGKTNEKCITFWPTYLDSWERIAGSQSPRYFSQSTSKGLRVPLSSTLAPLSYVKK